MRFMKSVNWPKPGYASITCSTISNIPYNLIFTTKFNDSSILITIISCDYLNLSLADEHVGDVTIDFFILKNMGAVIIDFRVCPPLVKCKNLMFSGFIDMLMYGFSSTGVTIYCYFGLKFNDNTCCEVICKRRYNDNDVMTTSKLPGMYYYVFLITVIFPIQNQYKSYLIKNCMHFFLFFVFVFVAFQALFCTLAPLPLSKFLKFQKKIKIFKIFQNH
jgi:hypothetical protein